MIDFTIDPDALRPPFEQVRHQVIDAVREGRLVAGEKLPTVRGLAETLGLAVNTVAKAYKALEDGEVIETRGRAGTFVSASGDVTHRQAQKAAAAYAALVRDLGLPVDEALGIIDAALHAQP